jgi:hypothetical protein
MGWQLDNVPPAWPGLATLLFVLIALKIGVLFTETLDSSGRVHQLLLTREKGMALGTNFNRNIFFGGANFNGAAAGTLNGRLNVLWMDIDFHCYFNPL